VTVTASTDRWFHDDHGKLVVFQRPNLPIIVWLVARVVGLVVEHGWPSRLLDALGFGALFTWAWLELSDGDAYIRRMLGGGVLLALLISRARG